MPFSSPMWVARTQPLMLTLLTTRYAPAGSQNCERSKHPNWCLTAHLLLMRYSECELQIIKTPYYKDDIKMAAREFRSWKPLAFFPHSSCSSCFLSSFPDLIPVFFFAFPIYRQHFYKLDAFNYDIKQLYPVLLSIYITIDLIFPELLGIRG